MGGLLSSGVKNATTITKYTQLDVQTSAYGVPIPIGWGLCALAGNIIDEGFFQAVPQRSGGGKKGGGKGGGGGGKKSGAITSYTYKVAVLLALCEGPIGGISTVYVNQQILNGFPTGLDGVPDTLTTGTAGQAPLSWLVTSAPTHALSYAYTAYVSDSALDLGSTPALPNYRFEIQFQFFNSEPVFPDANPADIVNDFLTNFQYGVGFGPTVHTAGSLIDGTSWDLYKLYCSAQQLLLSPVLDTQEQVSSVLNRWAALSNTWIFWSGGLLKFVPLGDQTVTNGFGSTYTPDNTAVYDLTYDDFVFEHGQLPVMVSRVDPADAPNTLKMEVKYRDGFYNAFPVEWKDQDLVDKYGQINTPVVQGHDICDPSIGTVVATLIGQRAAYIRNTYTFRLGWEFSLLEPGDIVTLTEPHIGLVQWPVRVRQLDWDDKGVWSVLAEEYPAGLPNGVGPGSGVGAQPFQPGVITTFVNTLADPGVVNPPMVFEPESTFTNGVAQLWMSASGADTEWGGCNVMISFDNANFFYVGTVANPARQGTLLSNLPDHVDPDAVNTLQVDLTESRGVLSGNATHADADALRTLCLVTAPFTTTCPSIGEFLAYGTSVLGASPYKFDLTYLRRGQIGTAHALWTTGSFFSRVDLTPLSSGTSISLVTYDLPAQYIGATVYLKFQSFNVFGGMQQDLASVVTYTYVPIGAGFGTGSGGVPAVPTGLTAVGEIGSVLVSWSANTQADNVTSYKLFRAPGPGGLFGSAVLVATTPSLQRLDSGLAAGSQWTYFLEACNVVGCSGHMAGVDATVATAVQDAWYQSFSVGGKFTDLAVDSWDGNYEIFDVQAPVAITFPTNFSTSPTPGCEVAPVGSVTLTFQTITAGTPTTVGTLTIAGGSTTGAFNVSPGFVLTAGKRFRCYAPAAVDTTIAGLFGTIVGTR